jgi:hypothetical protein
VKLEGPFKQDEDGQRSWPCWHFMGFSMDCPMENNHNQQRINFLMTKD